MPDPAIELTVLIPAYNEEESIRETIQVLLAMAPQFKALQVIVINDGSIDGTGAIVRSLPVEIIEHESNRGYGASLKCGLQRAKYEYILIADADGTYPLEDVSRLVEHAHENDMVVAARTGQIVNVPPLRRPFKWIITKLAEYLINRKIPDLNSGFRIFRRDVALRFRSLYPDGFSFTTTITLAMVTNNYRVKYVPINYHKRVGKSSIKPFRDFTNFVILIIRLCACFKPLNVFVPPALVLLFAGTLKASIDYLGQGHLGLFGIVIFLTGIQLLFIGLLADLIDQRFKL
jgi:glycosyltransferase involved in cell wall biosynthesis